MKKRFSIWMLAAFVALATRAIVAQDQDRDQGAPPQGAQGGQQGGEGGHWGHGGHRGGEGRMDPSKRAEMLSKRLNLSKDQEAKVRDIYTQQQSQMQSLMQNNQSGSREDNRAKFEELRTQTDSQIRAVLTPDQQQKFDQMLKEREQHAHGGWGGHRGQGQGQDGNSQQPPSNQ